MSRFNAIAGQHAFVVVLTVLFVVILTSASAQGDTLSMEGNTDRMGADYRRIDGSPSVEACRSACAADKECDAYTYVKSAHHCWLKKGVPGPTPNTDTVSGVKKRSVGDGSCATVDGVTCEPNTDRMGADYRRIDAAPSVQFCQNQCAKDPKCAAYTYVKSARHCWLKTGVPNGASNGDTVSGVKLRGPAPATTPAKESVDSKTYPRNFGNWQSVGTGDCPGRDIASSTGPNPDPAKCTDAVRGQTAVCWGQSCTYKNIATGSCTGGVNPGRMYTCKPAGGASTDDSRMKTSKPGQETVIFYNGNDTGVSSGGRNPRFSIDRPVRITYLFTYHYGYKGAPGKIRIMNATGAEVGIWQAQGRSGSPKASWYWEVTPNIELRPGTYLVETSSPGSWSQNAKSGGNGMVQIKGVYLNP
jgi:hypothetical protein